MREKIIYDFSPTRVSVGLSTVIGVSAIAGQLAISLQYISGGTLEITNPNTGIAVGSGFPIVPNSILSFDCAGTIFLASQGATSIVSILRGRSQGYEGSA